MTRIIAESSISLDGFVTGPAPGPDSGKNPDVVLRGGATMGPARNAGPVDALTLHLPPPVPGSGAPLLTGTVPRTLARRSVPPTPTATHLTYGLLG
ncbi:hypothetical protein [Streptomyces odontomachi]|uniref:hypothetical protein n=1 Tax=Streptomyces odontomachi TaxID=2944940 RepID=UPI00210D0DBE|nr:hypothetical protein [Streptomyces sp. ODS25]